MALREKTHRRSQKRTRGEDNDEEKVLKKHVVRIPSIFKFKAFPAVCVVEGDDMCLWGVARRRSCEETVRAKVPNETAVLVVVFTESNRAGCVQDRGGGGWCGGWGWNGDCRGVYVAGWDAGLDQQGQTILDQAKQVDDVVLVVDGHHSSEEAPGHFEELGLGVVLEC